MINILTARLTGQNRVRLLFSDGCEAEWDAASLLRERSGPLLEPLRDPAYFQRCFVDAGALAWPNGLELSPERLREQAAIIVPAEGSRLVA